MKDNSERYDILEDNFISLGTKFKYNYAKKFIKGKVIDIGCGLVNPREYFEDVIGVENDKDCMETLRKRYPELNIVEANGLNLPFKNEYFDGCLLIEVIEHVNDANKLLKEICRVLKPKGKCIITTPNRIVTDVFVKLKVLKPKSDEYHVKEYTIPELKEIVEANSFKIIKITGIMQVRYSIANWFIFKSKIFSRLFLHSGRLFHFMSSDIVLICEKC
ncbi:MAG: methyltransferase domain-containing protein [Candidatus Firestonebacteria bacterium]